MHCEMDIWFITSPILH